jgi:SAM-dependent methyltransferase
LVGLDLFHGMLEQARNRCVIANWVQGDSVCPPFADASFDYITNQFSYHHIPDKTRLVSETYRLLKPGGRFAITNLDPWSMHGWILYRYFPASHLCDLADFLPENELVCALQGAGFRDIRVRRELSHREETLGDFLAYASQRHRTSHLMVIDDQEYEQGIGNIRESIRRVGAQARVLSELCLIWVTGDKLARGPA